MQRRGEVTVSLEQTVSAVRKISHPLNSDHKKHSLPSDVVEIERNSSLLLPLQLQMCYNICKSHCEISLWGTIHNPILAKKRKIFKKFLSPLAILSMKCKDL